MVSPPLRVAVAGFGLAGEVLDAPLVAATDGLEGVAYGLRDGLDLVA